MGRVSGCVPRRRCREQKGEKKKKKIPALALHKPGLGALNYCGSNHHMEQTLAKSVFLSSEMLPTRML